MLGPTVLVLAPTRELASQIQDEVVKFGQSSRVSCTVSSDLISFIMALLSFLASIDNNQL
jgi:superfamily II DNA/RNA helicase